MSSEIFSTGISLDQARALNPQSYKVTKGDPAEFQAMMAKFEQLRNGPSPEDMVRQLAKQNNESAHTVIRRGGDVVAVLSESGGVTYPSNSAPDLLDGAMQEAAERGLSGENLTAFISQRMIARANVFYGGSFQVEVYGPDKGPTMGEINADMFGAAAQRPSALWGGSFDAQTLAYMDRLYAQLT